MKRAALPVAIMLVAGSLAAAEARAASLTLKPNTTLIGAPGSTVGWGYTITSDPGHSIIAYPDLGATIDAARGSVSFEVFDYPEVGAGATVSLAYDAVGRSGFLELTLAGGLPPGDSVSGAVFGKFRFSDETEEPFELPFTARVGSAPIPEPSTLLLLVTGAAGLWRRRR